MQHGKKQDGRGQHKKIPISDWRKQEFLKWLCTPPAEREPPSKTAFAAHIGMSYDAIKAWQKDREFLDAWEERYLQTIGNPGRKQEIMDTLFKTATDADDPKHVQAAKQYFEIEGSMKPQQMEVSVRKSPAELTDEELAEFMAEAARAEAALRPQEEKQSPMKWEDLDGG